MTHETFHDAERIRLKNRDWNVSAVTYLERTNEFFPCVAVRDADRIRISFEKLCNARIRHRMLISEIYDKRLERSKTILRENAHGNGERSLFDQAHGLRGRHMMRAFKLAQHVLEAFQQNCAWRHYSYYVSIIYL